MIFIDGSTIHIGFSQVAPKVEGRLYRVLQQGELLGMEDIDEWKTYAESDGDTLIYRDTL